MQYAKARLLIASSLFAFGMSTASAQVEAGGPAIERGQSGGTLGLISGGGPVSSNLEPVAPAKVAAPPNPPKVATPESPPKASNPRTKKAAVQNDDDDDDRPSRKKAKKKKGKEREVAEKERRPRTGFRSFARRYSYGRD